MRWQPPPPPSPPAAACAASPLVPHPEPVKGGRWASAAGLGTRRGLAAGLRLCSTRPALLGSQAGPGAAPAAVPRAAGTAQLGIHGFSTAAPSQQPAASHLFELQEHGVLPLLQRLCTLLSRSNPLLRLGSLQAAKQRPAGWGPVSGCGAGPAARRSSTRPAPRPPACHHVQGHLPTCRVLWLRMAATPSTHLLLQVCHLLPLVRHRRLPALLLLRKAALRLGARPRLGFPLLLRGCWAGAQVV